MVEHMFTSDNGQTWLAHEGDSAIASCEYATELMSLLHQNLRAI